MDDKVIYLLCALLFAGGLVTLVLTRPDVSPSEIVIEGEVLEVKSRGAVSFVVFEPKDFMVVSFDKVPPTGDVSLVGRLQDFEGKIEFVVSDYIPKNSDT